MIYIDTRIGSKHLAPVLSASPFNIKTKLTRLEFADCQFLINRPAGPESVGVELKTLADLLGSITTSRLLSHQIPGLLRSFQHQVLIVEGAFKPDAAGNIVGRTESWKPGRWQRWGHKKGHKKKQSYVYKKIVRLLFSLEWECGIHVYLTSTPLHTAHLIANLYGWGQKKKHNSYIAVDKKNYAAKGIRIKKRVPAIKFLDILPGIGRERRMFAVQRFGSIWRMARASQDQWREVDGIGPTRARRIWKFIRQGAK